MESGISAKEPWIRTPGLFGAIGVGAASALGVGLAVPAAAYADEGSVTVGPADPQSEPDLVFSTDEKEAKSTVLWEWTSPALPCAQPPNYYSGKVTIPGQIAQGGFSTIGTPLGNGQCLYAFSAIVTAPSGTEVCGSFWKNNAYRVTDYICGIQP